MNSHANISFEAQPSAAHKARQQRFEAAMSGVGADHQGDAALGRYGVPRCVGQPLKLRTK